MIDNKDTVKKMILDIQTEFEIKDSGMANLCGISLNTYKNCKSNSVLKNRNSFNINNLQNCLKNLKKKVKIIDEKLAQL